MVNQYTTKYRHSQPLKADNFAYIAYIINISLFIIPLCSHEGEKERFCQKPSYSHSIPCEIYTLKMGVNEL